MLSLRLSASDSQHALFRVDPADHEWVLLFIGLGVDTPWWRLDPSCRQSYKALFHQFNMAYACDNPVHSTLLDCLRDFTAATELEGVRCEGCGVLDAILDPSLSKQDTEDAEELKERLQHSLRRVRSSHDMDADLKQSAGVKESRGSFQKYELIGRPPHCLIVGVERKMLTWVVGAMVTISMNPFKSKQDAFVEFPMEFDLREFCLFTQVQLAEIVYE